MRPTAPPGSVPQPRTPWQPEDGDAKCERCWSPNPIWWAEAAVWNAVMGSEAGVLCPTCFMLEADSQGIGRSGAWQIYPPAALR